MIVVMGTIFYMSHLPASDLKLMLFPGQDKIAHFIVYGILAVTVIGAHSQEVQRAAPLRVVIRSVIICLLFGISDEFHQYFIPGRSVSFFDLVADVLGAAVVCFFWLKWSRRRGNGAADF